MRGNQIVGAVLFGDSSDGNRLFSMIQKQEDVSDVAKVSILQPSGGNAGESLVASMSADDIICGCNGVTKVRLWKLSKNKDAHRLMKSKLVQVPLALAEDVNRL
ncbi:hypothetical protein AAAC51_32600 [Priestia megaterium]